MRKSLIILLLVSITLLIFSVPADAENQIKVYLNGEELELEIKPKIVNDVVMVPIRTIYERLGLQVSLLNGKKIIQVYSDYPMITIYDGNKTAVVGSDKKNLPVAPQLIKNDMLIPLQFVAESIYCNVSYTATTKTVHIDDRVKNGWYNDTISGYKTKMISNMEFGGCLPVTYSGIKISSAFFTFLDLSGDLSEPVSACQETFCVSASSTAKCNDLLKKLYNSFESLEEFHRREKSIGSFLISFIDPEFNDEKRKTYVFARQEENKIYVNKFGAINSFMEEHEDEILKSIKTIGKL